MTISGVVVVYLAAAGSLTTLVQGRKFNLKVKLGGDS
jgi:hypothetical protein